MSHLERQIAEARARGDLAAVARMEKIEVAELQQKRRAAANLRLKRVKS